MDPEYTRNMQAVHAWLMHGALPVSQNAGVVYAEPEHPEEHGDPRDRNADGSLQVGGLQPEGEAFTDQELRRGLADRELRRVLTAWSQHEVQVYDVYVVLFRHYQGDHALEALDASLFELHGEGPKVYEYLTNFVMLCSVSGLPIPSNWSAALALNHQRRRYDPPPQTGPVGPGQRTIDAAVRLPALFLEDERQQQLTELVDASAHDPTLQAANVRAMQISALIQALQDPTEEPPNSAACEIVSAVTPKSEAKALFTAAARRLRYTPETGDRIWSFLEAAWHLEAAHAAPTGVEAVVATELYARVTMHLVEAIEQGRQPAELAAVLAARTHRTEIAYVWGALALRQLRQGRLAVPRRTAITLLRDIMQEFNKLRANYEYPAYDPPEAEAEAEAEAEDHQKS
jgi:hypothetical protein